MYKFDPMDFETFILNSCIWLNQVYKFDPMDFETKFSIKICNAIHGINLILWILKHEDGIEIGATMQ